MKRNYIFGLMALLVSAFGYAQVDDEVYYDACECIDEIAYDLTVDARNEAIDDCLTGAIMSQQLTSKLLSGNLMQQMDSINNASGEVPTGILDTVPKQIDIVINPEEGYEELQERLMNECSALETLISSYNVEAENSVSDNPKAIEFYEQGNTAMRNENFEVAIKLYKKALKEDKKFAFAWDNLGIAYRRTGDYDKAIDCYKKSLKLDPNGRVALGNIAIAYELKEDFDKALLSYRDYAVARPNDPEAYYGAGRMYHLKGDYENALRNMMKAYLIYKETNNPYIQDAESILAQFYNELEAEGREALFNEVGKEFNIQIED